MTKKPDFEVALAELEQLVQKMEAGELPLAQAMLEFEKGIGLVRQCQEHLDKARAQVEKLMESKELMGESSETSD